MFYNTETYFTVVWPFITAVIIFYNTGPLCYLKAVVGKLRKWCIFILEKFMVYFLSKKNVFIFINYNYFSLSLLI